LAISAQGRSLSTESQQDLPELPQLNTLRCYFVNFTRQAGQARQAQRQAQRAPVKRYTSLREFHGVKRAEVGCLVA